MKQHKKGTNMKEDQKEVLKAWIDGETDILGAEYV
jgi:hypothetical protein